MSYGQISEIFFMLVMPLFFARLGVKWMLFVGMLAWVTRYGLFALGAPEETTWMIIGGIVLHGICYDFFFVTGQIYTDRKAPKAIRAQAQGLLVMLTLGVGMLIGAQVAGRVEAMCTPEPTQEFKAQVEANGALIETLTAEIKEASEKEKTAKEGELEAAEAEKKKLRHEELAAIDWRTLWGIPAGFAALIMVAFVVLFKDGSSSDDASSHETDAADE
jgi:hypothetical protein